MTNNYRQYWLFNSKIFGSHLENIDGVSTGDYGIELSDNTKSFLLTIKGILNTIYDIDNWNIQFCKYKYVLKIIIVVKYDKLTVTNTQHSNQNTEIEDLYIIYRILIDEFDNAIVLNTIMGTRGKLTSAEFSSKYAHSHLPSSTINNRLISTSDFCLGEGSADMIYELLSKKVSINQFDTKQFQLLLYQMNEFVKWESEEGGPYRNIKRIRNQSSIYRESNKLVNNNDKHYFDNIINTKLTDDMFTISVVNSILKVEVDALKISKVIDKQYCYFISDRNKYSITDIQSNPTSIPNELIWNGERLMTTVTPKDIDWDNKTIFIKDKYKEYIEKKLEFFIFYNHILA